MPFNCSHHFISVAIWGFSFTKKPPAEQFVLEGENATFVWDYNETITGKLILGTWTIEGSNVNCISKDTVVSFSDDSRCQNFVLEGLATLILTNATKTMNNKYECILNFAGGKRLQSSTSLSVVSEYMYHFDKSCC